MDVFEVEHGRDEGPEVSGGEPEVGEPGRAVWRQNSQATVGETLEHSKSPFCLWARWQTGGFPGHIDVGLGGWSTGVILDTQARVHLSSVTCLPSQL